MASPLDLNGKPPRITNSVTAIRKSAMERSASLQDIELQLKREKQEKHTLTSQVVRLNTVNKLLRERVLAVTHYEAQVRNALKSFDEISTKLRDYMQMAMQLQSLIEATDAARDNLYKAFPQLADLDKLIEFELKPKSEILTDSARLVQNAPESPPVARSWSRKYSVRPGELMSPTVLQTFPLFSEFESELLEKLAMNVYEMRRKQGNSIVNKGEEGAEMFFIQEGRVSIMNGDVEIATLNPDGFFGEMGIMFKQTRTATVIAKTDCCLFVLTKQKILEALIGFPERCAQFLKACEDKETWWKERRYHQDGDNFGGEFLGDIARKDVRKLPMFADAPESFIDGLAMSVTTETFVPGQLIISKDEEADSMFFIMRGTVEVISTDGVAFAEMTNGQFFGEVGIILSMKRTASIRAKEESFLLKLTKDSLAKVVQLYPMMQQKINEVAEERFALFTKRAHSSPKTTPDQFDIDINQQNLLKLAVFQDIDCVIVSELALMMSRLSFEAGSVIIQCGDAANSMFFLAKGEVEVYSEFGLLIDTATGPTAWFGEVALLEHVPRTATIKARTDCFLYELKKADVMGMLEKYPVIGERIEETARERLQAYLMRNVLA